MRRLILPLLACLALLPQAALRAELVWKTQDIRQKWVVGAPAMSIYFQATNTGDQPIKVGPIKTSCGCATASADSTTVAPGKTVEVTIRITFDRDQAMPFAVKAYVPASTDGNASVAHELQFTALKPTRIQTSSHFLYGDKTAPLAPRTTTLTPLAGSRITKVALIEQPDFPCDVAIIVDPDGTTATLTFTLTYTPEAFAEVTDFALRRVQLSVWTDDVAQPLPLTFHVLAPAPIPARRYGE